MQPPQVGICKPYTSNDIIRDFRYMLHHHRPSQPTESIQKLRRYHSVRLSMDVQGAVVLFDFGSSLLLTRQERSHELRLSMAPLLSGRHEKLQLIHT